MAQIKLSQENYEDYAAQRFFAEAGITDVKFALKEITIKKTGEVVPLVHVSGIKSDGLLVNFDMWPRNSAAGDDMKNLPKTVNDLHFRIGYAVVFNTEKKQNEIVTSQPKWLVLNPTTEAFKLSGEKREYEPSAE